MTALERTYRNGRIAIGGTVLLIGIAVIVTSFRTGVLGSISAYYYTPARNVLVGALLAASVAILVLSGRGAQRALLDAAAVVAPVIALVPTPVGAGAVPGVAVECASGSRCVPADVLPDVQVGVAVYLIAGALAVGVVVALAAASGAGRGALPSAGVAAGVLAIVAAWWTLAPDAFLAGAHLAAAVVFFGLVAAVAVVNAVAPPSRSGALPAQPTAHRRPPARWLRRSYGVLAAALVLDLALTVAAVLTGHADDTAPPPVLMGESIALALFVVFWVLQSAERWDDPDPAVLAARS
ncbi:hypothetical protein NVV95_02785 [Herbiconiux sp. CPCC 205716]|uniref:Uncharacterized protein n=1 Tax=Herbiconiux gentiana TaxID=2970912 RepID=A0ABT2GDW6_9MICO|nr:hypothetical protein [Herbiconiux gentiana]MCS5713475.1 hypothetical protein [Herbiconiux gentiana]